MFKLNNKTKWVNEINIKAKVYDKNIVEWILKNGLTRVNGIKNNREYTLYKEFYAMWTWSKKDKGETRKRISIAMEKIENYYKQLK